MPSRQAIKRIKDKLRWEQSKADRSVQLKAYYEENKEAILETSQTKYCNNPNEKRSSSRIYSELNTQDKKVTSKKQYELNPKEKKATSRKYSKKQYELNHQEKKAASKKQYELNPQG